MNLLTPVHIPPCDYIIEPEARGLIVGSCFAAAIGEKLSVSDFDVTLNPQGVLYNPLSTAKGVELLRGGANFTREHLAWRDGLWHSFAHHGSFSADNPEQVLAGINHDAVDRFDYIIVTLGTSWVYERQGEVVANCHKFPEVEFLRRRISVAETLHALQRIRAAYGSAYMVLTVSPIRHLRDGLIENGVSKASLRVACDEFCALDSAASYFPAYEILMDELRDYRFYADDMLHPSRVAVELIFERFAQLLLDDQGRSMVRQGEKRSRAAAHRPMR